MELKTIEEFWKKAFLEILDYGIEDKFLTVLSQQTYDSIRRIEIYEKYRLKAQIADKNKLSNFHTSNPFVLSQRKDLSLRQKIWIIYLATYFGKSNKSKWKLFLKSAFDKNQILFNIDNIINDEDEYFEYLKSLDFFENSSYSNHRKFTKKSLMGDKGVLISMNYMLNNIDKFVFNETKSFDEVYKLAEAIPNFGRMAAFDFTSSLAKCELHVSEPNSMYLHGSSGPIYGLERLLEISGNKNKLSPYNFGDKLLRWFIDNTEIKFVAQVLEDAICNWQKSPVLYKKYFG